MNEQLIREKVTKLLKQNEEYSIELHKLEEIITKRKILLRKILHLIPLYAPITGDANLQIREYIQELKQTTGVPLAYGGDILNDEY